MNDKLEDVLVERSVGGRIACQVALATAHEHDVPPKVVGEALDRLEIRITSCQLGCFE